MQALCPFYFVVHVAVLNQRNCKSAFVNDEFKSLNAIERCCEHEKIYAL